MFIWGVEFEFGPQRIRDLAIVCPYISLAMAMAIRVVEFSNGGYKIRTIFT